MAKLAKPLDKDKFEGIRKKSGKTASEIWQLYQDEHAKLLASGRTALGVVVTKSIQHVSETLKITQEESAQLYSCFQP